MTWPTVRLRRVCRLQSGLTVDASRHLDGATVTHPYLRVANVQAGRLDLEDVREITVSEAHAASATLRPGDVLMTEGGDLDKLGRGTVWRGEIPGCLHQNHIFVLRPAEGALNSRYLSYVTQSLDSRHYFESTGTKTTNLASTSTLKLLNLPVPLPAYSEQTRIADYLDAETARIDRVIRARSKQVALFQERVNAIRDERVDRLFWSHGSLPLRRQCTSIEQGVSPACEGGSAKEGEWGVLKLSCVKTGTFYPEENKRLPADQAPREKARVHPGDLLVTRANTPDLVGDVAVVGDHGQRLVLPDLIYRVSLTGALSADFVAHVALTGRLRAMTRATARGTSQSMVKLRGQDIKEWPMPRAGRQAQQSLIDELRELLDRSSHMQAVLSAQQRLLAERRQNLITAAVTGEIDVTTAWGVDVS